MMGQGCLLGRLSEGKGKGGDLEVRIWLRVGYTSLSVTVKRCGGDVAWSRLPPVASLPLGSDPGTSPMGEYRRPGCRHHQLLPCLCLSSCCPANPTVEA